MKYSHEEVRQLYKDGMISAEIVRYYDIKQKFDSMPKRYGSGRAKRLAQDLGVHVNTIYNALSRFRS